MTKKEAEKKAERLSKQYETVAVVYQVINANVLGQHIAQYDACLQEHYNDEEDLIEAYFTKGKATFSTL